MLLRHSISLLLVFVTGVAVLSFAVSGGTQQATTSQHFLDPFNHAVQKRFHDVIGFGMARIGSERSFKPETAEEKEAVRDLKKGRYQVGIFLAGRVMLQDVPQHYRVSYAKMGSGGWHMMSGPVVVDDQMMKGLPDARAMWEPTREALRQFGRGSERWGFEAGGWSVEARPVRASEDKCLRCHAAVKVTFDEKTGSMSFNRAAEPDDLKIGDPVGAVLYVYRKN